MGNWEELLAELSENDYSYGGFIKQALSEVESLRAQLEAAKVERDVLVDAIDREMVSRHLGVFSLGADASAALGLISDWDCDLGKHDALEEAAKLLEKNGWLLQAAEAIRALKGEPT